MANPVVHFEIVTKDPKAAQDFYAKLFGWTIDASNPMGYGIVNTGAEGGIGGGIAGLQDGGQGQVTWYVAVDDPQAYLDTVERMGGKTVMLVTEIPGMVTIASFTDPQGNLIGLVKEQ